ncbi:MAG: gliding motility-associated C-terminal domain-containing protein [Bacteroidota bacterium]
MEYKFVYFSPYMHIMNYVSIKIHNFSLRWCGMLILSCISAFSVIAQNKANYNLNQCYIRENKGQSTSQALFIGQTPAGNVFFYKDSVVIQKISCKNNTESVLAPDKKYHQQETRMQRDCFSITNEIIKIPGHNNLMLVPSGADGSKTNYFVGNDPSMWIKDLPNYNELAYHNLSTGESFRITCDSKGIQINQQSQNKGKQLTANFSTNPLLLSSSYVGGTIYDQINAIDIDELKNIYLCGLTKSLDFPLSNPAYDTSFAGATDGVVLKFDSTGNNLIFSTYLGGYMQDVLRNIHVKPFTHEVIVSGYTASPNYPTTASSYMPVTGGLSDVCLTCLNSLGNSLIYSTYIGGSKEDLLFHMIVDSIGNTYLSGSTGGSFPVTTGSYQTTYGGGQYDLFLCKVNASGSGLIFSTYIGGPNREYGGELTIDKTGNCYLGCLTSGSSPITPGAYRTSMSTTQSYYLCKLSPSGNSLLFGTYCGWANDSPSTLSDLAVDSNGVYCIGLAGSSGSFATTSGVFTNSPSIGGWPGPIALFKMSTQGDSLRFATVIYYGGSGGWNYEPSLCVVQDKIFFTYLIYTPGTNWSPIQATLCAFDNTFPPPASAGVNSKTAIFALSKNADKLLYLSYFGGSKHNAVPAMLVKDDIAYLAGYTDSQDLPLTNNCFDSIPVIPGSNFYKGLFARIKIEINPKAMFDIPTHICTNSPLNFQNNSHCSNHFLWKFGDGDTSSLSSPSHTYHTPGNYTIILIANNDNSSDTVTKTIIVQSIFQNHQDSICSEDSIFLAGAYRHLAGIYIDSLHTANGCDSIVQTTLSLNASPENNLPTDTVFCSGDEFQLNAGNPGFTYQWNDGSSGQSILIFDSGTYSLTVTSNKGCSKSSSTNVQKIPLPTSNLIAKTTICQGSIMILSTDTCPNCHYLWNNSSTNPSITISQSGIYIVTVSNDYCSISDSALVEDCVSLQMPNVFTPNGDGHNDLFIPDFLNVDKFELTVFNRWGELIIKTTDITKGWDGTKHNKNCPDGTYFYMLEYQGLGNGNMPFKARMQGTVTLLR